MLPADATLGVVVLLCQQYNISYTSWYLYGQTDLLTQLPGLHTVYMGSIGAKSGRREMQLKGTRTHIHKCIPIHARSLKQW